MGFHMPHQCTGGMGDCLKSAELEVDDVVKLLTHNRQLFTAEVLPVKKTWMYADSDAPTSSRRNCLAHAIGIPGVKSRCNIGRTNERQQFFVRTRTLSKIRVEIDGRFHAAR